MDLQLYFVSAYYVSALEQMFVKVLDRTFFVAYETNKSLPDDNLLFRLPCKP